MRTHPDKENGITAKKSIASFKNLLSPFPPRSSGGQNEIEGSVRERNASFAFTATP
jgi:hypothetical protein